MCNIEKEEELMKKLLLAITVIFTFLLGGCGEKLEPYESIYTQKENGITYIITGTKLDGKLHGKQTWTIKDTGNVEQAHYYKNGKQEKIESYYEGTDNIRTVAYIKDGKLEKEAVYRENGSLFGEILYKDGEIINAITYDEKGKKIDF